VCGRVWCGFVGVSVCSVWDSLVCVCGSECVLCVGQFGVGFGSEFVLFVGLFVVGLGE